MFFVVVVVVFLFGFCLFVFYKLECSSGLLKKIFVNKVVQLYSATLRTCGCRQFRTIIPLSLGGDLREKDVIQFNELKLFPYFRNQNCS